MGGPPIPVSTDPVAMLQAVVPSTQKRMMESLSDDKFWIPVMISLVKEYILPIPAVQKALGNIGIVLTKDVDQFIEKKREELCPAPDDTAKHDAVAKAKNGLKNAFQLPMMLIRKFLQMIRSMEDVVTYLHSQYAESKDHVMTKKDQMTQRGHDRVKAHFQSNIDNLCAAEEEIRAIRERSCGLVDHFFNAFGGNTPQNREFISGFFVDFKCDAKPEEKTKAFEDVAQKLKKFTTIEGCEKDNHREADLTLCPQIHKPSTDTKLDTEAKDAEDTVKTFMHNFIKFGELIPKVVNGLPQQAQKVDILTCSPALFIVQASTCKRVFENAGQLVMDMVTRFAEAIRKTIETVNDPPDQSRGIAEVIASCFDDVANVAKASIQMVDAFVSGTAVEDCTEALNRCEHSEQCKDMCVPARALADIFTKFTKEASEIKILIRRVSAVATFAARSVRCATGLVPPITNLAKQCINFLQSANAGLEAGGDPLKVVEQGTRLVESISKQFEQPMQCVEEDIVNGLTEVFEEVIPQNALPEVTKMVQRAKAVASTISRVTPIILSLINTMMTAYGQVVSTGPKVQAFLDSVHQGANTAFLEAMELVRKFQQTLAALVMAVRDVREVLALFQDEQGTVMRVLAFADRTLTGVDAACHTILMVISKASIDGGVSDGGSFLETGLMTNHQKRLRRSPPITQEDIAKLATKLDEHMSKLNSKMDSLQKSQDVVASKMAKGVGGGAAAAEADPDTARLKAESKNFQKEIEREAKSLGCPATHTLIENSVGKELLAQKNVDLLLEHITVPTELTYGVIVKVGIYVSAAVTVYLNSIVCDCVCTARITQPCAQILKVGPEIAMHLLGVGSLSVSVKILTLTGTASIQLGSLYLHGEVSISRVLKTNEDKEQAKAQDKANLCVRHKRADETKFGVSFQVGARLELLAGSFKAGVTLFGIKLSTPALRWSGLHWKLATFCYEPPKLSGKLPFVAMNPSLCASARPSAFTRAPLMFSVDQRG